MGFFRTLGALGRLALWPCLDLMEVAVDAAEGGREGGRAGGRGDVERASGAMAGPGAAAGNTLETGVRDFMRDDAVGIVSLNAAGLDEGVEGRVGGTL